MKDPKHPCLTPLRALALLVDLERAGETPSSYVLDRVKAALRNHVEAELTRKRRAAKRGAR